MGYRVQHRYPEFGDGGDGDLHLQADALIAKPEYNLRSLIIDAGVTWSAPVWWGRWDPIVVATIRCQTPIVLHGAIEANGVTAGFGTIGTGQYYLEYAWGHAVRVHDQGTGPFWTFPGGGGSAGAANFVAAGAIGAFNGNVMAEFDAATMFGGDFERLIGPGRPYRYGAGGLGGSGDGGPPPDPAAGGGGCLVIAAPGIQFGDNAAIRAEGYSPTNAGEGGAGGGYIEIVTRTPVASADQAKISVAGGVGNGVGGNGLDGFVRYEGVA